MKKEYDFSGGERGEFFCSDAELNIRIYLDPEISQAVREHARGRKRNVGSLVNEWLRRDLLAERQRQKLKTR